MRGLQKITFFVPWTTLKTAWSDCSCAYKVKEYADCFKVNTVCVIIAIQKHNSYLLC